MIYTIKIFILFVSVRGLSLPTTIERAPLFLGVGEQRILALEGLKRFSLSGNAIRSLRSNPPLLGSDQLLLKGIQKGVSQLIAWKEDGTIESRTIYVQTTILDPYPPKLREGLNALNRIEVIGTGSGVVLRGTIDNESEAVRIKHLKQSFPKLVDDQTLLSEKLLNTSFDRAQEWVRSHRLTSVVFLTRIGNEVNAEITHQNPEVVQQVARELTKICSPLTFAASTLTQGDRSIHFRVILLEIKRERFHEIGIQWPASLPSAFQLTPHKLSGGFGASLNLNALAANGAARILSSPELVIRTPGEAEVFSGGELPIRNQGRYQSNVDWRPHGLKLHLKTSKIVGQKIDLEILAEMSQLDEMVASADVPGIQSNRLKTQVVATLDTPLFLSGLVHQTTSKSKTGVPILYDLPVFGAIFGSEKVVKRQSEMVAIIVPSAKLPSPQVPQSQLNLDIPRGPLPIPRNTYTAAELQDLQQHPNYPWNAFR